MSAATTSPAIGALLIALVAAPAAYAALLLLLGRRLAPGVRRLVAPVGIGLLAAAAGAATWLGLVHEGASTGWPFLVGAELRLTVGAAGGLGSLLLPVVLAVAAVVLLSASGTAETREPRFVGLMQLFAAAAALTVLADTLPTLLLGWEVMGATSYALIGYRYGETRRVRSGATALLTTRAADLGLYVAVAATIAGAASIPSEGPDAFRLGAVFDPDGMTEGWQHVAAAGILVAALGKAAQLPFSFWIRRAMDGPSPVSALLHSAAMVALGGYLLIIVAPLLAATGWADLTAAWIGVATAIALGAVAVVQTDLKQLLAASTTAQLGFVVLGAGVGATSAAGAHLVAHAAVKAGLFLVAGAYLEALGSKRLDHLAGAARRWFAPGLAAVLLLAALGGLPPLALWATKDAVLAGALEIDPGLYIAGLVAAAFSTAYATVAAVALLRPTPSEAPDPAELEERPTGRIPRTVPVALAPLTLAGVGLGLFALPRILAGVPGEVPAEPHGWELIVSAVLVLVIALAVGVICWRFPESSAGEPTGAAGFLHGWLGLEPAVHAAVVRPTLALASLAARVDDALHARVVVGAGHLTLRSGSASSRGDGRIAGAVDGVARAARSGGRAVRRGAVTGQLHHYYLQLVAGVLALVVVAAAVVLIGSTR